MTMRSLYPAYVLTLLFITNLMSSIDKIIISILLPQIQHEFALTDLQSGVLAGLAFLMFYALFGIPIARVADRGNRRNVIALAVLVWSAMTAACGLAVNFWSLLLARMGVGVGEAGCVPPAHSLICDYFPPERRAGMLAVYSAAIPLGSLAGLVVGGWLGSTVGWRATFLAFGVPGLIVAFLVRFTLREAPRHMAAPAPMASALKALFAQPAFSLMLVGIAFSAMATTSLTAWLPSYFARAFDLNLAQVGLWFGLAFGLGSLLGMIAGGVVGDLVMRRDSRWALWISCLCFGIAAPLIALALTTGSLALGVALQFVAFALMSLYVGSVYAFVQIISPPHTRALAIATVLLAGYLLGGFGPMVVGQLSDVLNRGDTAAALRTALLTILGLYPVSIVLYWRSARALRASPGDTAGQGARQGSL